MQRSRSMWTWSLGSLKAGVVIALCTFAALTLVTGVASVLASSERDRHFIGTKDCSQNQGRAGDSCTITSSNLAAIPVDSQLFYDQAAGIPAGLLDSNVILDAGSGNRVVGRCTFDLTTNLGLCTFQGGIAPY